MPDLPLSRLAGDVGLATTPLHEAVASEILKLFKWSVIFTGVLTAVLVGIDTAEICAHVIQPVDRLVTEKVLMSLIGATVVQVGATSAAIVYSLFKTKKTDDDPPPRRRNRRSRPEGE